MNIARIAVALALAGVTATAVGDMDPAALAAESLGKLANAKAMSVDVAIAEEAVLSQGLKIRTLREGSVVLSRSDGFKFSRSGALVDQQVSYDGKNVYGIGDKAKVFVSVPLREQMTKSWISSPGKPALISRAATSFMRM